MSAVPMWVITPVITIYTEERAVFVNIPTLGALMLHVPKVIVLIRNNSLTPTGRQASCRLFGIAMLRKEDCI